MQGGGGGEVVQGNEETLGLTRQGVNHVYFASRGRNFGADALTLGAHADVVLDGVVYQGGDGRAGARAGVEGEERRSDEGERGNAAAKRGEVHWGHASTR